jgi:hypothetical protein
MAKAPAIVDVIEEMFESILATPKRQRRLLSKTFWDKFGFGKRTRDRVEQVREAIKQRGIILNLDESSFGTEGKDEWIVLTFIEPAPPITAASAEPAAVDVPTPPDSWFEQLERRVFEGEREVEYYFIVPLLEQLGYEEDDFAIGYPVQMYEGVKRVNKEADFVLFNGSSDSKLPGQNYSREKKDALLVIEAKKAERILTEDSVGQARAYAMWLTTPYYVVTNGEDIRVYLFRGAVQPDVLLMNFKRADLRQQWRTLYEALNKKDVIAYKGRLLEVLEGAKAL